jgi:hypothetical protein
LRQIVGITIGGFVGLVAFYFVSAYLACEWLWPGSDMCGIPAVMIVAPMGIVVGAVAGWRLSGRTKAI